jgi:hypothetical protein
MSKKIGTRLAVAALFAISSTLVLADTATLNVSATVKGVCKMGTTSYTMTFATLDPSATGSPDGTMATTVGYKCTKGTVPATFKVGGVSDGSAGFSSSSSSAASAGGDLAGSLGTNTDRLPYKITWTAPTTAGDGLGGTLRTFDLTGTITYANYSTVTADTYSGAVGLEITP